MKYDFITVLDRTGADSIAANIDPWGVSPAPAQRIPMWVADMSFPTAPPILEAMHKRLAFPNFGYFSMPDGLRGHGPPPEGAFHPPSHPLLAA